MAVTVLKKGSLALAGLLLVAQAQATELLNSSYDVSRELFAALNPPFEPGSPWGNRTASCCLVNGSASLPG